ncbi:hypothetical protein K438DRAFT_1995073 [Mycena galopus ATCC 62051]|nr:hypothetical protein K438DRAFT_1995073 [Mycena galopus ATCC 62051]
MSNTEESGHHTRAATRAGLFEAPPPVFGPAEAPSDSTSGSQHGSHSNSSPRATLYSTVVNGEPVPLEHGILSGVSDAGFSPSELAPLRGDADFGTSGPEVERGDGGWTPVSRKTARSHRARSASGGSNHTANKFPLPPSPTELLSSPSTLEHAAGEMSREQLLVIAQRYQNMADNARPAAAIRLSEQGSHSAVPAAANLTDVSPNHGKNIKTKDDSFIAPVNKGDNSSVEFIAPASTPAAAVAGPSNDRGKGPDPRNWGNLSFGTFGEDEIQAQRDAFENFSEINRVIKQEGMPTPPGFFDELPIPDRVHIVRDGSDPGSHPSVVTPLGNPKSSQTKDEIIAELESRLSYFEQQPPATSVRPKPVVNQAKAAVSDHIANLVRPDHRTKKPSVNPEVRFSTPGRIAVGSTLDKAIRASA